MLSFFFVIAPPPTIITDLLPHQTYFVRVRTQFSGGWSKWTTATRVAAFHPKPPMKSNVQVNPSFNNLSICIVVPTDGSDFGLTITQHEIIVWSTDPKRYRKGKFFIKKFIDYSKVDILRIGEEECRKNIYRQLSPKIFNTFI